MNSSIAYLKHTSQEVLSGFGQIMLQSSPLVGAIFFAGALVNSYTLALSGLVGCVSGVLTAQFYSFPDQEKKDGLYGFNGALVGLGLGYFYDPSLTMLVAVVFGGCVSSGIMRTMMSKGLKPFTFPFVVTAWLLMMALSVSGLATMVTFPAMAPASINLLQSISRGYGQVLFQEHVVTGLIIMAIITIKNWPQGFYAALGSLAGIVCGYVMGFPIDAINLGLFGYNGVLCGILFSGGSRKHFLSATLAVLLSIVFVRLFHIIEIPALTMPFVGASWIVLWGQRKVSRVD